MVANSERLQKYSAPALEKGLDILEFLALSDASGMTHGTIAAGIGRSKNEIFRMMVVLEERGYIQRVAGDLFSLTSKTKKLSRSKSELEKLSDVAQPFMARLCDQTELSNHLWIRNAGMLEVFSTHQAPETYSLSVSPGTTSEIFGTSAGASFYYGGQIDQGLQNALASGQSTPKAAADFLSLIEACKRDKVCISTSKEALSICEASSPITAGAASRVIGVLSIPFVNGENISNKLKAITDELVQTTRRIEDKLALLSEEPQVVPL